MPSFKKIFSRSAKVREPSSRGIDDSQLSVTSEATGDTTSTSAAQVSVSGWSASAAGPSLATTESSETDPSKDAYLPGAESEASNESTKEHIAEKVKALDPENVLVTINNLKGHDRPPNGDDAFDLGHRMVNESRSLTFEIAKSSHILDVFDKIDSRFRTADRLVAIDGKEYAMGSIRAKMEPFHEVVVTENATRDPNEIGLDERLIAFNARRYGEPFQVSVAEDDTKHGKAVDCLKTTDGLKISFLRTVRMPDDGKLHSLPAALGTFPLYNVAAYADALPEKIVQEGGVFLPMWQREALWIGLQAKFKHRYALRVSVGRINAISGRSMDEDPAQDDLAAQLQDYVVVPGQDWLDGICVDSGTVRQFVAMPLGSGYTVEGQKTGEEKHGGLQIEIIPSSREGLRLWASPRHLGAKGTARMHSQFHRDWLEEYKTPRQLGLVSGDKIQGYPSPPSKQVPYVVSDLVDSSGQQVILSAKYWANEARDARSSDMPVYANGPAVYSRNHSGSDYLKKLVKAENLPNRPTPRRRVAEVDNASDDDGLYRSAAEPDEEFEAGEGNATDGIAPKKDLRTMGLAAGGLLIQDIYKDQYSPAAWNTAGSKLINIHILDPYSCESVTHVVPAPPPIDAEAYAKAGLQFYTVEERPDDRLEGGDFGDVKSVAAMDKQKLQMEEKPLDPKVLAECRCGKRLCDCVVRPCNHQLCHMCVREVDTLSSISAQNHGASKASRRCPVCQAAVSHVAGFAAPMNLPGEEPVKMRVPVQLLEVRDGRMAFKSIVKSRI